MCKFACWSLTSRMGGEGGGTAWDLSLAHLVDRPRLITLIRHPQRCSTAGLTSGLWMCFANGDLGCGRSLKLRHLKVTLKISKGDRWEPLQMEQCQQCGSEVEPTAPFCSQCGNPLKKSSSGSREIDVLEDEMVAAGVAAVQIDQRWAVIDCRGNFATNRRIDIRPLSPTACLFQSDHYLDRRKFTVSPQPLSTFENFRPLFTCWRWIGWPLARTAFASSELTQCLRW